MARLALPGGIGYPVSSAAAMGLFVRAVGRKGSESHKQLFD